MPVTIDASVGGASSNSYVTLAEAATYMTARLNASAWETDATTDNKNRALVEATRELNVLVYEGFRAASTQALAWPRFGAVNPDQFGAGHLYLSTEIPQRIKDAQCELALEFIKAGTTDLAALPATDGVISKTVDVLSTTYADPTKRKQGLARFPRVMKLIAPLLDGAGSSLRVIRA